MVEVPSIVVFIVCMAGCSYQSYLIGIKKGAANCLQYLHDNGVIELEGEEDEL